MLQHKGKKKFLSLVGALFSCWSTSALSPHGIHLGLVTQKLTKPPHSHGLSNSRRHPTSQTHQGWRRHHHLNHQQIGLAWGMCVKFIRSTTSWTTPKSTSPKKHNLVSLENGLWSTNRGSWAKHPTVQVYLNVPNGVGWTEWPLEFGQQSPASY